MEADGASDLATEAGLPRHRGFLLRLQSIRSIRMKNDELNEKYDILSSMGERGLTKIQESLKLYRPSDLQEHTA